MSSIFAGRFIHQRFLHIFTFFQALITFLEMCSLHAIIPTFSVYFKWDSSLFFVEEIKLVKYYVFLAMMYQSNSFIAIKIYTETASSRISCEKNACEYYMHSICSIWPERKNISTTSCDYFIFTQFQAIRTLNYA